MLQIIEGIVYIIRFLLEMVTVFGLIVGGLIVGERFEKLIFPLLGILIIIAWSMFVAPKASHFQGNAVKFFVEVIVFGLGTFGIFHLFGERWGTIYLVVAIIDLALVYLFLYINP